MQYPSQDRIKMNRAMALSLALGVLMLLMKVYAFFLTNSTAILSDAAESVVHLFAVGFATYSMWLSHKPADANHTYGHDRITFFSAGFEGGFILIASLYIIYHSIEKLINPSLLENLDSGMAFIAVAMCLNGALGYYLVRLGNRFQSLVLQADGKHLLTDCLTSLGVILALVLTWLTGWSYFDPLLALLVGVNIFWTGIKLIFNAFHGLMDRADPLLLARVKDLLDNEVKAEQVQYHRLRLRDAGNRLLIEVHLMFPSSLRIVDAHEIATSIEKKMEMSLDKPVEMVTHLEPIEGHDEVHVRLLGREG